MNIVIDENIVKVYRDSLTESLQMLQQAYRDCEALKKQADANQLFTIQEACAYLKKDEDTLRYYRKFGLDYYKKGQQGVWYRKGDIDDWLEAGKVSRHSH